MATQVTSTGVASIVSHNPATGEALAEVTCATPHDVRAAVQLAKAAQSRWQATPVSKRVAVLRRFQELLREQRDDVSRLICREAGKPAAEALATEVMVVLDGRTSASAMRMRSCAIARYLTPTSR